MKAVATMTPEPKYLARKKAHCGTPRPCLLEANTGNHVPNQAPTRITKIAEIRTPRRPLYSFPVSHAGGASGVSGATSEEVAVSSLA